MVVVLDSADVECDNKKTANEEKNKFIHHCDKGSKVATQGGIVENLFWEKVRSDMERRLLIGRWCLRWIKQGIGNVATCVERILVERMADTNVKGRGRHELSLLQEEKSCVVGSWDSERDQRKVAMTTVAMMREYPGQISYLHAK